MTERYAFYQHYNSAGGLWSLGALSISLQSDEIKTINGGVEPRDGLGSDNFGQNE